MLEVHRERGEEEAAEQRFRTAIRADPSLPEAHANLAAVLREKGDLAGAEKAGLKAVELAPDLVQGQFNLALVLQEAGKYSPAADAFTAALALDTTLLDAYIHLGTHSLFSYTRTEVRSARQGLNDRKLFEMLRVTESTDRKGSEAKVSRSCSDSK